MTWLNDTALGRTIKVLVYVAISGAVTALIAWFTDNPDIFNPYVVAEVNLVLVALKNFIDPQVKNV